MRVDFCVWGWGYLRAQLDSGHWDALGLESQALKAWALLEQQKCVLLVRLKA